MTPNEVFFGEIPVGKQVCQDILVDNIGMGNYKLDKIELKDNLDFSFKNLTGNDMKNDLELSETRMAKVKVFFVGKKSGVFETALELYFSNEIETVKTIVPVKCEVLENVSFSPFDLSLPRKGITGPVYSARISLKIASEDAFDPDIKNLPKGITIKPIKDQRGNTLFFDINVDRSIVSIGSYVIDFGFRIGNSIEIKKYSIYVTE